MAVITTDSGYPVWADSSDSPEAFGDKRHFNYNRDKRPVKAAVKATTTVKRLREQKYTSGRDGIQVWLCPSTMWGWNRKCRCLISPA